MTDVLIAALIGAVAVVVVALINRNSKKLDQIHILVNSNLTQIKADLAQAVTQISYLEGQLLASREETAHLSPPPPTP
jgi:hypothetical protein